MADYNDPANSSVKPGWKSTEFQLTALANVIGLLLIVLPMILKPGEQSEMILKVVGGIALILGNLGYVVPRSLHKTAVAEGAAAIAIERIRADAAPAAIALLKSAGISVPTPPAST